MTWIDIADVKGACQEEEVAPVDIPGRILSLDTSLGL